MQTETIIGIIASTCTAFSLVPQLVKLLKEKKAENISLWMMVVLFAGLGLWIYYGILKNDWILIISNGFSFFINLAVGMLALKYKGFTQEEQTG